MRVLGRGPLDPAVRERIEHREPGVLETMTSPAICKCSSLYDVDDPDKNRSVCVLGNTVRRIISCCYKCVNASVCLEGEHHGEVQVAEDGFFLLPVPRFVNPTLVRSPVGFERAPVHQRGWCSKCGQPMVWDVEKHQWVDYVGLVKA